MKKILIIAFLLVVSFAGGAEWRDKYGHSPEENEAFRQGALFGVWRMTVIVHGIIPDMNVKTNWDAKHWGKFVKDQGW